jgi:hypothetical protein
MRRLLYLGLVTIVIVTVSIGLLASNYEAYGLDGYFSEVSEVASFYSLDNTLCAFEIRCDAR